MLAMFRFTANTAGTNMLGLRELLQNYADGFGVPVHVTADHATEIVYTAFRRQLRAEVELLELTAEEITPE
jgi:hypothetical protein